MRYDMHSHSTASDGSHSPTELVELAATAGLDGLALTDHDTVAGIAEAMEAGARLGVEVIPGIELSIQEDDEDIHMLGFWINHESAALRSDLDEILTMRERRIESMLGLLGERGMVLGMDDVRSEARSRNLGRPHLADAMCRKGFVHSRQEAFDLWLGNDRPAYVPKSEMDAERGFALLERHGAVPVWAHPALLDYGRFLAPFVELGLQGLEVDHPKHSEQERGRLRAICLERGLSISAGSDYHGPSYSSTQLGCYALSADDLARLRARRRAEPA